MVAAAPTRHGQRVPVKVSLSWRTVRRELVEGNLSKGSVGRNPVRWRDRVHDHVSVGFGIFPSLFTPPSQVA
jgi:hypothetical protein